uniref:Uncharacterized protein n=1 Tax=Avena sativa TaxID=4498 RepID=A0ACD5VNT9_AVESA
MQVTSELAADDAGGGGRQGEIHRHAEGAEQPRRRDPLMEPPNYDSDYDLEEDDEQFKKNVDSTKNDLVENTKNRKFKLGMVFFNVQEVRDVVSMYHVRERRKIKKKRNNIVRVEAMCVPGCPWKFVATRDSRIEGFVISRLNDVHTCDRVWEVKEPTRPFIAKQIMEEIRDNENITLKSLAKKVQKRCNMPPNIFKLARAKFTALKKIRGDEIAQYDQLWD